MGNVEGYVRATISVLLVTSLLSLLPAVSGNACPVGHAAVLLSSGNLGFVNAGNLSAPTRITSGCTYDFFLKDKSEMYLKLARPSPRHTLSVRWNYKYEYKPPVLVFSWNGQCCLDRHPHINVEAGAIYGDFLYSHQTAAGSYTFEQSPVNQDVYHCNPACRTFNDTSAAGDIFITMSTWYAYNTVEGSVTFSFDEAFDSIQRAQLDAVKSVYDATCGPWQAPSGYSGTTYVGETSTDTDTMPYCDWLPGGWNSAWGENSCEDIPGVRCDAAGNVVELKVSGKGLRGVMPTGLASALPHLVEVSLDGNRLTGGVLELVRDLKKVETFSATHNMLTGRAPCPGAGDVSEADACTNGGSPLLTYALSFNTLTGSIPGECIARCAPQLTVLQLESNRLTGGVPAALKTLSLLAILDVSQNELTGTLPAELSNLEKLQTLDVSLNRLTGVVPPVWMTSLKNLYTLDLSFNRLEGEFPMIDEKLTKIRRLYLGHNQFRGKFEGQLTQLASALETDRDAYASGTTYSVLSNAFSGPLPHAMYTLFTTPSTAVALATVEMGGNHFRCDPVTGSWPQWALRLKLSHSHVLGQCTPVPTVTAVLPAIAAVGEALTIIGTEFKPSDEARCRFALPSGGHVYTPATVAAGVSGVASCTVPSDILSSVSSLKAGAALEVSIAIYGDDFYDPATIPMGNYTPANVTLACGKGFAGERCQFGDIITCSGHGEVNVTGGCKCMAEFAGTKCQYNSTLLCNWPEGGVANEQGTCACKQGYAGGSCQYSYLETCLLRGKPLANGTCECNAGYEGKRCEIEVEVQPKLPKWAQWFLGFVAIGFVSLVAFMYYMVRRERQGEPLFASLNQPLVSAQGGDDAERVGSDVEVNGDGHVGRRPQSGTTLDVSAVGRAEVRGRSGIWNWGSRLVSGFVEGGGRSGAYAEHVGADDDSAHHDDAGHGAYDAPEMPMDPPVRTEGIELELSQMEDGGDGKK